MINGTQYQVHRQLPAVRPPQQLGAVASLGVGDWFMLGGGAIVTGIGLTGFVKALPAKRKNASLIGLAAAVAVTLVGGTAFVQNFQKLTA
jgi:hypothetical protein